MERLAGASLSDEEFEPLPGRGSGGVVKSPSLIRTAHGSYADVLAPSLVVETPPLDEIPPVHASDSGLGLASSAALGKPFTRGNRAAAKKGPELTRTGVDLDDEDSVRRSVGRKAESLRRKRVREERARHGGVISSGVETEIASWALAISWSRHHYSEGETTKGAKLAEQASAHLLKAVAIAEREHHAGPGTGDEQIPGFVNGGGRT